MKKVKFNSLFVLILISALSIAIHDRLFASEKYVTGIIQIESEGNTGGFILSQIGHDTILKQKTTMTIKFKKDRSNPHVSIYSAESIEVNFLDYWGGKQFYGRNQSLSMTSDVLRRGYLNTELPVEDYRLTLIINRPKKTYKVQGTVHIKDIPYKERINSDASSEGITFLQEDESNSFTQDKQHEINISEELKNEKILKGSKEIGKDVPEEMKNFIEQTEIYKFIEGIKGLFLDNFNNTVSWEIVMGPMLNIKRDEQDITSSSVEVIAGEELNLVAEVYPSSYTAIDFQWEIPGKCYKEFKADQNAGHAIALNKADRDKKNVSFYWVDGTPKREVVCIAKVGEETLKAAARFKIFRPELPVVVEAPLKGTILKDTTGQWMYSYQDQTSQGISVSVNEIANKNDIKEEISFEIQWVQLVETTDEIEWKSTRYCSNCNYSGEWRQSGSGIDTCYPYCKGPEFSDIPDVCQIFLVKKHSVYSKFKTYLMFKPDLKNRETEWVPAKQILWSFGATVTESDESDIPNVSKEEIKTVEQIQKTVKDIFIYPDWQNNIICVPWCHKQPAGGWLEKPQCRDLIDKRIENCPNKKRLLNGCGSPEKK